MANTTVPVGFIKDTLHQLEKQANGIAAILEELKVPHLKVIYERLYYARRADQWMDIFRFVGVGPMSGLTMDHIRAVRFGSCVELLWSRNEVYKIRAHVLFPFILTLLYFALFHQHNST